jgi:glycerophosphoryl diester phosphodiesterase
MTRIIAHRGARNLWAENSLDGFRRTTQLGVDAVELDLHLSHDGAVVVIHDPLLDRTTNGHGPVSLHSL